MSAAIHIAGVACPCGCVDLVLVAPGSEPVTDAIVGIIGRGTPGRGWCCIEHARLAGWPWLRSEAPRPRRTKAA